ncbi:SAM-dependent methyltransferase [Streptomyces sp. NPDC088745]|uniref:SAM-dependent methyltransferase n=1 Tax=Streptomyces sp. NPDC088745 TaxID=3365884 RepID=UPI00380AC455
MNGPTGAGSHDQQRLWLERANSSRLYNWLLGDVWNMRPDRVAAHAITQVAPWARTAALINREFAERSVGVAAARGIRQFLDLGCGYPVRHGQNTHELAEGDYRVVYADHDWCVLAHARTALEQSPRERVVRADVRAMNAFLTSPEVREVIDLSQPVAVGLHDVLPWIESDAVSRSLRVLREWMPPGSLLSCTHFTGHWHPGTVDAVVKAYANHLLDIYPRSRDEIAALFGGLVHLGPGLTAPHHWHPSSKFRRRPPEEAAAFAGIAFKPL